MAGTPWAAGKAGANVFANVYLSDCIVPGFEAKCKRERIAYSEI
jgi:hypothetical protein